jgi:hypothetical protein
MARSATPLFCITLAPLLAAACASHVNDGVGTGGQAGTQHPAGGGGTGPAGRSAGTGGAAGSIGVGAAGSGGAGGAAGSSGAAGVGGARSGGTGGAAGSGGNAAGGGGSGGAASGGTGSAANPKGSCSAGIPDRGQPADTSAPTTVVGTGSAASCTFSQLQAAVTQGGVITFNCGASPTAIVVTATLNLPTNKSSVIDGGNKITLDGGNAVQILSFNSPDFRANDKGLTLQHITLINGKKTPTKAIPTAPAPCSQGWDDGEGGALYVRDGALTVIDSVFMNNQAAPLGPDTGGGAIYILGSKAGAMIVGSTFSGNTASNAGAVGALFAELDIYNSLFTNNKAIGHDANNDDASKCSVMNNGQHEIGSGGNGGAIYSDGQSVDITLCGDAILDNAAGTNAFGGGIFFTSNNMMGVLSITDTTITGNTGGHWTNVTSGSVMNVGTAVGVNAKSITVKSSTIQGYP